MTGTIKKRIAVFAAGVAMLGAIASAAPLQTVPAQSEPLDPAGPWTVDAKDNGTCLLARNFGTGANLVSVGFQPSLDQTRTQIIMLAAATGKGDAGRTGQASIALDPGGLLATGTYFSAKIPDKNQRLITFGVNGRILEALSAATSARIKADSAATVRIGGTENALAELKRCRLERLASWGIDPATYPTAAVGPTGIPGQFSASDYPKGSSGRVVAMLDIDEHGTVTGCRIVVKATPDIDRITCEIVLANVHFRPATDEAGKSVRAWFPLEVRVANSNSRNK